MAIIPIDNLIPIETELLQFQYVSHFALKYLRNTDQLVISSEKTDSFY